MTRFSISYRNITKRSICDVDLGAEDYHEWSALINTCGLGHKDIAKLLLDHPRSDSINFNGKNHLGDSALLSACNIGHWDVVKLLLDHPSSLQQIVQE